jgi:serine/threonine protein kinase
MDLLEQLTAALGDRYRVERELGHGGMAVVFLAEDLKHRRRVAIKLLKPDLSALLGSERFLREIEIAVAGKVSRARSILAALRAAAADSYVPAYYFALVHAGLGEREQALRYLERAYEERSTVLAYLLIDPRLAPLRDDARFLALARRLGGE